MATWTAQVDPTIAGFYVYAEDQGPDAAAIHAEAGTTTPETRIYCAADATYLEIEDASSLQTLSDASLVELGCTRGFPADKVTGGNLGGQVCKSTILVDLISNEVTASNSTTTDGGTLGASTVGVVYGIGGDVGVSTIDARYIVGDVGNTSTTANIESAVQPDGGSGPLVDGRQYAIAVAAYDDDGNVGLLSPLFCQTPEPVTDFLDPYTQDGGGAGGGFCDVSGLGHPSRNRSSEASFVPLCAGLALLAFRRIGRRSRRRSSSYFGTHDCTRT